jgi:hypothetical protein
MRFPSLAKREVQGCVPGGHARLGHAREKLPARSRFGSEGADPRFDARPRVARSGAVLRPPPERILADHGCAGNREVGPRVRGTPRRTHQGGDRLVGCPRGLRATRQPRRVDRRGQRSSQQRRRAHCRPPAAPHRPVQRYEGREGLRQAHPAESFGRRRGAPEPRASPVYESCSCDSVRGETRGVERGARCRAPEK